MKMTHNLRLLLPKDILLIVNKIAKLAEKGGYKAYLVGGLVRDILLGVKNMDLDIVVEGDGPAFAALCAHKIGAALVVHKKFGTASLIMRKKPRIKIDIATARREFYEKPAALPLVEFSSIKDDLQRRDFTINAMALSINRKDFGTLIDFFGGTKDLAKKRIRVLHEKSFIDDPTRIFRAVRFEQRYGFRMDDVTARLIRNAKGARMFDGVSGERLRTEIELLLGEKDPVKVTKRMNGLDELRFISSKVRFGTAEEEICRNVKKAAGLYGGDFFKERPLYLWLVYFMALIDSLSFSEAMKVCARLMMKRSDRSSIAAVKKSEKKILALLSAKKTTRPSEIYSVLVPLTSEALLFIMAKCTSQLAKRRIGAFLKKYKWARLSIGGEDIKRLGKQPGPYFAEILQKTLYAKIDGVVTTRQDELAFARTQLLIHETEIL
ncbi:MAG: CCA tRNA nucleotidyltransferase [Candidatus Omnitrophica bacterium]|nr:CCA tRNA nucleotidyltransferase [Candidatus Omnitrophota bacterium]MBU4488584.1 CCA tRNA nucleotidyltransferase [Candidatus Omnitrophota bacterium]MCG2704464.1 CCA tRNA nucleotidyltransferase [Candidatus Omnitrophota bacterium]